jgi:hypothetical protein
MALNMYVLTRGSSTRRLASAMLKLLDMPKLGVKSARNSTPTMRFHA